MVLTPQIAAIIAFALGAVIFFAIGYLIPRASRTTDGTRRNSVPTSGPGALRDNARTTAVPPQMEEITQAHDQAVHKYLALKAYTADQKAKTQTCLGEVKTRVLWLKDQLQRAHAAADASKKQSEMLTRELERSSRQNFSLHKETAYSSKALETVQIKLKAATERLAALSGPQEEHQRLLGKIESTEGLQKEFEGLRDENQWLKSQLSETKGLRDEIDELKKENARLNAMGAILDQPPPHSVSAPLEGLGGAFQNISNRLSRLEGSRGVALADELGLLIAGTGEHMEAMAGMAAVFSEVCLKTEALLPFGKIDAMTISNRHDLTIAMQPFNIASVNVIITTLSVGNEPDRDTIANLIHQENFS